VASPICWGWCLLQIAKPHCQQRPKVGAEILFNSVAAGIFLSLFPVLTRNTFLILLGFLFPFNYQKSFVPAQFSEHTLCK
jgi:hypothetical protein